MKLLTLGTLLFSLITSVSVGQDLKFSELASKGKGYFKSYETSDSCLFKIGDKLKIGQPSSGNLFSFITNDFLNTADNLSNKISNEQVEIKQIVNIGNSKMGYHVKIQVIGGQGKYVIKLEDAIASGELKSLCMTSNEALQQLKKAKEKLDLGLITQEEYDKIKAELAKYIK